MAQLVIELAGGRRSFLLGLCMPELLTSFAANKTLPPTARLKRPRAILACPILPCLLVGCTGLLADGLPEPPSIQYTRADRKGYIEWLRAKYPEWAAHQTLDDIPSRQQWLSSQEIRDLRAKQTRRGDDPVEWVPFERPAAK